MRITGMATGLDMDQIIKDSMKPYRIKVDQMTQKKDVVEIKQKLYRDVIKDNRDFFNKHLDIVKSDSLLKESNWSAVSFSSSDENAVTAKASGGAIKDNYTVSVEQLAQKATATFAKDSINSSEKIEINGKEFSLKGTNNSEIITDLNNQLKKEKIDVKMSYSTFANNGNGGFIIENNKLGPDSNFKVTCITDTSKNPAMKDGTYVHATITNSKGDTYTISDTENKNTSNGITVDGITFNFNEVTKTFKKKLDGTLELDAAKNPIVESDKPVKLTGKTDTKDLKDKVVAFVNDYNKLIEKLNTTVGTKHDRSYNPLTAEQKKDMSESEIKLWNERVDKGQLYRDSDVIRIANSMKDSMRTLMEGSGLNLEKIGIKPVKDYSGTLNGTFTIDEDKLTKALENNTEDVMKLFTATPPEITEDELKKLTPAQRIERKNKTGVLYQLKDIIDTEFRKSTSSPLLKKAGFEGTATFSTNQLSKNITNYEKKIKDMEKNFSRREQALYSKYASLEKMMNKLNSQQSSLMSQLGMS